MAAEVNIDALMPAEMARKAEVIGVKKAGMNGVTMFILAVLAGAFIALGAVFATTVFSGGITVKTAEGAAAFTTGLPYGVTRLLGGMVFCLGLILVVVSGAELFTGNNLIVMAWANGKVTTGALLRNWSIVYLGNFVGSLGTALLVFTGKQYEFGSGAIGLTALNIASSKVGLGFLQAIALGILCNALVCLAVWMTYSARSTLDKIAAIIFPITAFVAAGFEHSIANMYFIPIGLFIKSGAGAEFWKMSALVDAGKTVESFGALTWQNFFLGNLLPVTIGNIIGGAVMVGMIYWFIYRRNLAKAAAAAPQQKAAKA